MGARGRVPQIQEQLDDTVFDLQCSAAAQVDNTFEMLADLTRVFADGLITQADEPYIRAALNRAKAEHAMNRDQDTGMGCVRRMLNPFFALVTKTRSDNQRLKKQTARG